MVDAAFSSQKCVPCRSDMPKMTPAAAQKMVAKTPSWTLTDAFTKITKTFEFPDFVTAMRLVNQVAEIAEEEGHHPDIFISWNKVTFTNYTHKIGGLHENDFILAAKIDQAYLSRINKK